MLPKTMKAAVIHAFGAPLQIEQVPVKEPGENEILVRVVTCGVYHTDLHACQGNWPVNVFLGVWYNAVRATLANNATGTGAGAIKYDGNVSLNRLAFAGGCLLTRNIMLKGEYVIQQYKDFPVADFRAGGKFNGYVIEATVGF
jgi:hypothetical protein